MEPERREYGARSRLRQIAPRVRKEMSQLKLIAFDEEDLKIVSAHLQDAIARVGDMAYLPREKRFAAVVSRFDWSGAHAGKGPRQSRWLPQPGGEHTRFRSALRFERVLAARTTGLDLKRADDVHVLLAVSFERRGPEEPSGTVTLTFAGKAAVQLDVECLEAELKDMGPGWSTKARPRHPSDDEPDKPQPA